MDDGWWLLRGESGWLHVGNGGVWGNVCYNRHMGEQTAGVESRGLRVSLPLPPGVNNLYISVSGRRVLSGEGKRFKAQVAGRLDEMRHDGALTEAVLLALRASYLSL